MATITPSVLISDIRNKAGSVVFSSWKGRNYIRKYVIPGNPKSDDQMAIRNAFSRCVACYQGLANDIQDFLDILGSDLQMSGFNRMMSTCIKKERDSLLHRIIPPNSYVDHIEGYLLETSIQDKKLDISWITAGWTAAEIPTYLYRAPLEAGYSTPWVEIVPDGGAGDMTDGLAVLTMPDTDTVYAVCMIAEDDEANFSGGEVSSAASGTA
ncbi:hypothetical protein ES703_66641 [subsurface metagenome]